MFEDSQIIKIRSKMIDLLLVGTREMTHLDYKRELFHQATTVSHTSNTEKDEKLTEIKGYTKLLSHIMGMYNTPKKYGSPFPSILSPSHDSSYIIFGVDYKENKKTIMAQPIDVADASRGFIDERSLQDQVQERFNYPVAVNYYEVQFDESDIATSPLSQLGWFKPGCYGLLEIVHDETCGPIFAKQVTDKKPGKGIKNEIAHKLYIRKQGLTSCIDPVKSTDIALEQECLNKFDKKYSKYTNRLEDLKKQINPKQKSFQILVTTPASTALAHAEQKQFISTISRVKWNVIFDTDNKTAETNGFYDVLHDKLILPVINTLPKDMVRLQDDGWRASPMPKEVAYGQSCLYVFTNGDLSVGDTESPGFQRTDFQALSKIIFRHIHLPLQLYVYVLVLNPVTVKNVEQICKAIGEAWDDVNERTETKDDDYSNINYIFISHHESLLYLLAKYLPTDNDRYTSVVAPFQQIVDFFRHLNQKGEICDQMELPGSAGRVCIDKRDKKLMAKDFDIYDIHRGETKLLSTVNDEEKEKYIADISTTFLQGFPLTPEAMYLHDIGTTTIYVKRDIIIESYKRVHQVLLQLQHQGNDKTPLHRTEKNIVQLIHEPSAGGTTVGRYVLWHVREDFPALMLTNLESNSIVDWLVKLFNVCQLPLCILIDTSIATNVRLRDVEQFGSIIKQAEIRAAIFFVQQLQEINESQITATQLVLQNKVKSKEQMQFDRLFAQAGELLKKTPSKSVSLYGLCQFGTKYAPLEDKLNSFREKSNEQEKFLLLLSSITFSYCKQPLPFYFVAKILKTNPQKCYEELDETLDLLHMARDFLIVKADEVCDNFHNGIRPVTSYVSNKILEIVFDQDKTKGYLRQFIYKLLDLLESSNFCDQAVTTITKPLFVQRTITEGMKDKFSRFVADLEEANGISDTVPVLQHVADKVGSISTEEGPHIRAMLARYIAYRKQDIDNALAEMRRALNVDDKTSFNKTMSRDSALLTTAGNLITLKLTRMAKTNGEYQGIPIEATDLFKDAQLVLWRAQKNEYNCYSFVVEARLLYTYMNLYYCLVCKKNNAAFTRLLGNTSDDILKSAAEQAMLKLSQLECILHKHEMEGYDEKTEEQIIDLKMKILGLKIDITRTKQSDYLQMCETDPWLVRGLVDFYFYQMESRMSEYPTEDQQKPTFEMLAPQALQNIINLFKENISNGLTGSNYRYGVLAMIYIYKQPPRMRLGNLELAQQFARLWSKNYPDDNRPHYFMALMYLIEALSTDSSNRSKLRRTLINKMKESYQTCKELCSKKGTNRESSGYKWHPSEMHFVLGAYDNLAALVPKDTEYDFEKLKHEINFRFFTGRARSADRGNILYCEEFQSEVRISRDMYHEFRKYAQERPKYSFILQTRTDGFFVEKLFPAKPVE